MGNEVSSEAAKSYYDPDYLSGEGRAVLDDYKRRMSRFPAEIHGVHALCIGNHQNSKQIKPADDGSVNLLTCIVI